MLKNPFRIFKPKRGKKDNENNQFCDNEAKEEEENEDLDFATEAMEDLFITEDIRTDLEESDEEIRSQSSEASTIALLPPANIDHVREWTKPESEASERSDYDVKFEEILSNTNLASLLFGMESKGIAYPNKNDFDIRPENFRRMCLNPEFVKSQLKLLLQSPTFQMDIQKLIKDSLSKNKRVVRNVTYIDKCLKDKLSTVPRSVRSAKILKRAKMKAKRRSSGFHTNIYFKGNYPLDNSKMKLLNDACQKEIANSLKDSVVKTHPDTSTYSEKITKSKMTTPQIHEMINVKVGYITKCIEAAWNGNDCNPVFECVATVAIFDPYDQMISTMKESVVSLTPKHLTIRTNDISKSVILSNFSIHEISIDEFQQIMIIDNSIRLCNFYSNNDLQRFLVLLEYLIRKNANESNSNEDKVVTNLMRPLLWNDLLKCKERIVYVTTNVGVTWYKYVFQNLEEMELEKNSGALLTCSRSETRVPANFKFYGSSNLSVMERPTQDLSEFQSAYFEVKANTLYMYHRRYDALPTRYWILNQGEVEILNLDEGEDVIENPNMIHTDWSLEDQNDMAVDSDTVPRFIRGENNNESICQKAKTEDDNSTDERQQLLLELPNKLSLILCFQCEEMAVKFHEKIQIAMRFQETNIVDIEKNNKTSSVNKIVTSGDMNLAIGATNLHVFNFQETVSENENINLACISTHDKVMLNEIRDFTKDETNDVSAIIVYNSSRTSKDLKDQSHHEDMTGEIQVTFSSKEKRDTFVNVLKSLLETIDV